MSGDLARRDWEPSGREPVTRARVGRPRAGVSVTTADLLAFQADHALARDAVHADFDAEAVESQLSRKGIEHTRVRTRATSRSDYLRDPDLGRQLAPTSAAALRDLRMAAPWDVVLILSDGLSALAANRYGGDLVARLVRGLRHSGASVAPVMVAPLARVGLLDDVGGAIGARVAAIILGERPGLSSPDNLSVYVEARPRPGLTDAERNCIANINPRGLPLDVAAAQSIHLIGAALRGGITGTDLKVELAAETRSIHQQVADHGHADRDTRS